MCRNNNNHNNHHLEERLSHLEIKCMLHHIAKRLDELEILIAEAACLCDENDECVECDVDVCRTCIRD